MNISLFKQLLMGLPIEPGSRKQPILPIAGMILLIVAGLTFWLQYPVDQPGPLQQPAQAQAAPSPSPTPAPTTTPPPPAVKLVRSEVVAPLDEAFTADLYRSAPVEEVEADWPWIDGRTDIERYTVQEGDTMWGIAASFGLDLDTLRWSNPDLERNPDVLTVGSELVILPIPGVYHTVVKGDTLQTIASQYGVSEAEIINFPLNHLQAPYLIKVDEQLVVPYGRKDIFVPPPAADPDSRLAWPVVGHITQGYHDKHHALDIGSVYGTPIYAAAAGTVTFAHWAPEGYGYTVKIQHADGLETSYNHLKGHLVSVGQRVVRGQEIGAMGSTGRSTGPHLHFEVRKDGQLVDPQTYLSAKQP